MKVFRLSFTGISSKSNQKLTVKNVDVHSDTKPEKKIVVDIAVQMGMRKTSVADIRIKDITEDAQITEARQKRELRRIASESCKK